MLTSFTRKIDVTSIPDSEGLYYDLERAQREGLYETITFDPEKLFDVVLETEVSVNVPPYTPCVAALERNSHLLEELDVVYAYHYGSNPVPEIHHDGFGHTVIS